MHDEPPGGPREIIGTFFGALTDDATEFVAVVAPNDLLCFASRGCEDLLGYEPRELVDRSFLSGLVRRERDKLAATLQEARAVDRPLRVDYERRGRDGRPVPISSVVRNLDAAWPRWLVVTSGRGEAEVAGRASRLHTAGFFHARIQEAVEHAKIDPDRKFAVLVMEISEAQLIKSGAGPQQARQLIEDVALRLKRELGRRSSVAVLDVGLIAALIFPGGQTELVADEIAAFCQRALDEPFKVDGHAFTITAVSGIVLSSGRHRRADELLADAKTAKHRAMRLGGGAPRTEVFGTFIGREDRRRFRMAVELPRAITEGLLEVHYQPLVRLSDGALAGVEVLARWRHPDLGQVSPSEFIPFAEEMGQVAALDRWILLRACQEVMSWPPEMRPFLSANISALQLGDPELILSVASVLEQTGIPPQQLHLELTESAVAEDAQAARQAFYELKSLGVHLSLDDFGTGYSSFAYLADLPLDTLKIDRTFVCRMHIETACEGIVHGVIAMAQRLGLSVVAEGVELLAQADLLRALGCDFGQGFLYSRPVPADQVGPLSAQATQAWAPRGPVVLRSGLTLAPRKD